VNLSQCNAGFAKKLSLNDEAEPTISHPTAYLNDLTCDEGIYMEVLKAQWKKSVLFKAKFQDEKKKCMTLQHFKKKS